MDSKNGKNGKNGKIKIGILGMGGIAEAHVPFMIKNERAELLAICDSDEAWLASEKARLGVKYAYADYNELLKNEEIDAVIVCLPNCLHADATVASLNAGKHVLCQKPMACTAAEAGAMCAAMEKAGKKLMISHNQRFEAPIRLMKKLNDEGRFGDVYVMRIGWQRPLGIMPSPFSNRPDGSVYNRNWFNEKGMGGGVLRDLGTHLLDLALYITGFPELESASASLYRKFYPDMEENELSNYVFDSEDLALGHIKFKNGLSMQIEVSFGSMIEDHKIITELYGDKGGASRKPDGIALINRTGDIISTEYVKQFRFPVTEPNEAFLDAVINDTEPFVTAYEGKKVIEILDAMYASSGRIIKEIVGGHI